MMTEKSGIMACDNLKMMHVLPYPLLDLEISIFIQLDRMKIIPTFCSILGKRKFGIIYMMEKKNFCAGITSSC